MPVKNIVLIGAGNVATQLGNVLFQKGVKIIQVYSRTQKSAEQLASKVGADAISDFSNLDRNADLYIISVPDDVIGEISSKICPLQGIVVHTSGSVEINIFKNISSKYGVFYPLQTFSKSRDVNFSEIPVCIEASDQKTEKLLTDFAAVISLDVRHINSEQRANIHLAAVFVNNFTNYMYFLGEDFLKEKEIPFDILYPLIRETAEKIKHKSPHEAQTGPAIRDDKKILLKHIKMLADDPEKLEIYRQISLQISKMKTKAKS